MMLDPLVDSETKAQATAQDGVRILRSLNHGLARHGVARTNRLLEGMPSQPHCGPAPLAGRAGNAAQCFYATRETERGHGVCLATGNAVHERGQHTGPP